MKKDLSNNNDRRKNISTNSTMEVEKDKFVLPTIKIIIKEDQKKLEDQHKDATSKSVIKRLKDE